MKSSSSKLLDVINPLIGGQDELHVCQTQLLFKIKHKLSTVSPKKETNMQLNI